VAVILLPIIKIQILKTIFLQNSLLPPVPLWNLSKRKPLLPRSQINLFLLLIPIHFLIKKWHGGLNEKTPSAQEEVDLSRYDAWYIKTNLKGDEKPVFLTFDCGYENGYTASILDVLKKHKAPGAFFLCRHYIEDQPELVKRMKKEEHIVGNHTSHHVCMPETDSRKVREEITDNANYMKEATGYEMDRFFRPPKGEYSERTLQITKDIGYTTVFWSMAYLDYDVDNQPGSDYVINHFEKYIHPGAIPLIHNISKSNAEALDTVLTNLEKEGYTFHSLSDLKKG